ncbi:universal stress protein [Arthrobacter sp. AQ5-05]|uniref:universal stress protein n=1 Tax=Arthrobacter sp. AQ5-05 TaxID=2184581 RepID=UPI000DCC08AE|nr:universal stress protein [Arthrobacter sp. AQ5-05]RAX48226.1 universal stress protein [Arthrobacter sp. AQ5-05]
MSSTNGFQIVVGIDGSASSLSALKWAVTEARLRQARIRMVTAWQYPATGLDVNGPTWDFVAFEQDARTLQDEALKSVDSEGTSIDGEIRQGPSALVLLDASKDADLLIVGSRGRGGFTGLLLGSVSTQIVHHATCPVLIIRD